MIMPANVYQSILKQQTITGVLDVVKKNYDVKNCSIGSITRGMIIVGLKSTLPLNDATFMNDLNQSKTLGDIISVLYGYYPNARITNMSAIVGAIDKILLMTRPKKIN